MNDFRRLHSTKLLFLAGITACIAVYVPGLSGGFLFDDFPNIVDNPGVLPKHADIPSLVRAMLSSPSSELKRPLASLTFALNFLTTGLDPFWMKLTNLVFHLMNGGLVFLVGRCLLADTGSRPDLASRIAVAVAIGWLVLPINLTSVLYVVQRMESLANLAVLGGLYVYMRSRSTMLVRPLRLGRTRALLGLVLFAILGLAAKETSVLLPLYALILECFVYRWGSLDELRGRCIDRRLQAAFVILLGLPLLAGLAWLLPPLLTSSGWAGRNFSMSTRLLSEARIVLDYIYWTFIPAPQWLSFYHDNYVISTSWTNPWTTLFSITLIGALGMTTIVYRHRFPLFSTGIGLYAASQTLTGTILPLELVYEHRAYFGSFALLLAAFPLLAGEDGDSSRPTSAVKQRVGWAVIGCLIVAWAVQTSFTAYSWGDGMRLARELAARARDSPRAQYEHGRAALIASHYDPDSPYLGEAEGALKRAASLPESTILPEQALIFARSRMHRPVDPAWWDGIDARLRARRPGVQDESSLGALTQCRILSSCEFDIDRLRQAFLIALDHDPVSARMWALYGDFAWGLEKDSNESLKAARQAVATAPREPAYRVTLVRRLIAAGALDEAEKQLRILRDMDIAGALDDQLGQLRLDVDQKRSTSTDVK